MWVLVVIRVGYRFRVFDNRIVNPDGGQFPFEVREQGLERMTFSRNSESPNNTLKDLRSFI